MEVVVYFMDISKEERVVFMVVIIYHIHINKEREELLKVEVVYYMDINKEEGGVILFILLKRNRRWLW